MIKELDYCWWDNKGCKMCSLSFWRTFHIGWFMGGWPRSATLDPTGPGYWLLPVEYWWALQWLCEVVHHLLQHEAMDEWRWAWGSYLGICVHPSITSVLTLTLTRPPPMGHSTQVGDHDVETLVRPTSFRWASLGRLCKAAVSSADLISQVKTQDVVSWAGVVKLGLRSWGRVDVLSNSREWSRRRWTFLKLDNFTIPQNICGIALH